MRLKCVEKRGGGGNGDKEKERRKINEKGERSCGSWVMVYEDGNRLRQRWEHATSFRARQHEKTPQSWRSQPHADLVSGCRCHRFRVDRCHSFAHLHNAICALHSGVHRDKCFCSCLVTCECKWNIQRHSHRHVKIQKNGRHKFLKDQEEEEREKKAIDCAEHRLCRVQWMRINPDSSKHWAHTAEGNTAY